MSVLIGDKDCIPVAVFNKMNESPGGGLLSKWKELAHNLEISDDAIDQLSQDQVLRKMTTGEIYIEMLKTYRSEKKHEATLKNLIFVLENKLNMGDIGDILKLWLEEILREREAQKSNSNNPPEVPAKKPGFEREITNQRASKGLSKSNDSLPNTAILPTSKTNPEYKLVLVSATAKQLLTKFQIFVNNLPIDNANMTNIICQVLALEIVDDTPEVHDLKTEERNKTGTKRFQELLKVVEEHSALNDSIIETVFNKLINLQGLEILSDAFRKRIEKAFSNGEVIINYC